MSLEKKAMLKLSESDNAYLFIAKNYINHLDLEYFNNVTFNINDRTDALEEHFLDAHHKIISDILRHINNSIFKGNTEDTLLWMETELNNHTWEAFNSMTF